MQVNTNLNAIYASNSLQSVSTQISDSVKRISTGQKLSIDDPASIGMGARLKAQIAANAQINQGVNIGIGMAQAMDAGLSQVQDILSNMYAIAASSNNNYSEDTVLAANDMAYQALLTDITTIKQASAFWGTDTTLLDNTDGVDFILSEDGVTTFTLNTYDISDITADGGDVTSQGNAQTAMTALQADMQTIAGYQAEVGAALKTFDSQISLNNVITAGLSTAYSQVTSVDLASETAKLASDQIRQNAAAAMFAQSNTMSREVVSYLLKGL
jgi:flagellin